MNKETSDEKQVDPLLLFTFDLSPSGRENVIVAAQHTWRTLWRPNAWSYVDLTMRRKETNKSSAIIPMVPRKTSPSVARWGDRKSWGRIQTQPNITECQAFSLAVVNTLVKHFQYESSGIHTLIYSHTNILEFIDCFFFLNCNQLNTPPCDMRDSLKEHLSLCIYKGFILK